jgi:hypothetical protein
MPTMTGARPSTNSIVERINASRSSKLRYVYSCVSTPAATTIVAAQSRTT